MDEPRLTDEEFRELVRRVQHGVTVINENGGFSQVRRGRPFDPRRSSPPYTDIEEWIILWYQLWDQMSDEANRRHRVGVSVQDTPTIPWPQMDKIGGGRKPDETPDEYVLRMRSIIYPKKRGGRRSKKNDNNRQNTDPMRATSLFTEGDSDV